MSSWVKNFSFRLKHFLAYFLMFLDNIDIKLPSTTFWALHQLNLLFFLLIANRLFGTFSSLLGLDSVLFRHLSFKNGHKILIRI